MHIHPYNFTQYDRRKKMKVSCFNVCIDAITSSLTSKLYIPIDTDLIIAEKYNEISNKQMTYLMHYFGVSKLCLKPIYTYNVGTKYYHMQ